MNLKTGRFLFPIPISNASAPKKITFFSADKTISISKEFRKYKAAVLNVSPVTFSTSLSYFLSYVYSSSIKFSNLTHCALPSNPFPVQEIHIWIDVAELSISFKIFNKKIRTTFFSHSIKARKVEWKRHYYAKHVKAFDSSVFLYKQTRNMGPVFGFKAFLKLP